MGRGRRAPGGRSGFTLVEMLIVIGLIAVLLSLLLPVVTKARASANAAVCASNLRQVGTAWAMYVAENHGRLPGRLVQVGAGLTPDTVYQGYWPGIVEKYKVGAAALLCPAASDPSARTVGSASQAWSGRSGASGTGIRFNAARYREASYGYNGYLFAGKPFTRPLAADDKVTAVRNASQVPLFMDCAVSETEPANGDPMAPVAPPPDLQGRTLTMASAQHWRFLLARHGRAINVCMVDGSVRRAPLEETYQMRWTAWWVGYRLMLPLQ